MKQYLLGFFNTAFIVITIFFFRAPQSNNLIDIEVISVFIIDLLNDKKTIFDSDTLIYGGWIPHLTFTFTIVTIKLSLHQYRRTYSERKEVRDKVRELHNKGRGYTKIHKYLINNGYEIGKSRTTVYSMIKKMKKREYILGLQDQIRKYEDFKIQYFRV